MKDIDLGKIDRYINMVADDMEKSYVESLFSDGTNNPELRKHIKEEWEKLCIDSSTFKNDINYLLGHIHHTIRKNEVFKSQRPLQRVLRFYMKIAAVLLLPLLIAAGIGYNFIVKSGMASADEQVLSTIYAPMGARVSFTLPDGTTGMLNSGSRLSYSLPFNTNRRVKIEGEGWFEVTRDENHPFEIGAGSSTIKVLGTSFNLSAYPSENYVEVVLKNGSVEFQENESDGMIPVFPSERLIFRDGNISKSFTDPEKYNAWTEGKLVFRGDPMAEVARRMERWFGVKVELGDKELEKYSFRATFQDDKLEDVLRFLSLTSPIRYKITPRKIHDDGTFEKELVTIFLRKS